jgi:chromosome segregation ATPase
MSDLIERLRNHERHAVHDYDDDCEEAANTLEAVQEEVSYLRTRETNYIAYIAELEERQAEIERLEKDIDESNDENAGYIDRLFEQKAEIEECKAEIERLRGALERIASGCDLSNEAQAIAREALENDDD